MVVFGGFEAALKINCFGFLKQLPNQITLNVIKNIGSHLNYGFYENGDRFEKMKLMILSRLRVFFSKMLIYQSTTPKPLKMEENKQKQPILTTIF
jgi:hypothetical protein